MKKRLIITVSALALCPLLLFAQYSPFELSTRAVIALEAAWAILGGSAVSTDGSVYGLQTRMALAAEGIQAKMPVIQVGTNMFTSDSRITNTFATAFTTAPYVTLTRFVIGTTTNAVLVSVSTTNFIAWGQTNAPFHWQAISIP